MNNKELPLDPFTPKLPRVGSESIQNIEEEISRNPDYLRSKTESLMSEQTDLMGAVAILAVELANGDQKELLNYMSVAALTYGLIEAQSTLDDKSAKIS